MKKRQQRRKAFGHYADHPVKLAEKAIRDCEAAPRNEEDNTQIRAAAELGWLAASSAADKIAKVLGRANPGGFSARRSALLAEEIVGGARSSRLAIDFASAKSTLHGDCFHENKCDLQVVLLTLKDAVLPLAKAAEAFERNPPKKKRRTG